MILNSIIVHPSNRKVKPDPSTQINVKHSLEQYHHPHCAASNTLPPDRIFPVHSVQRVPNVVNLLPFYV